MIRPSKTAYNFLKEKSKLNKTSIAKTLDLIIEFYKKAYGKYINLDNIVLLPQKENQYLTYKRAFFEHEKSNLRPQDITYYERSDLGMKIFFEQNKKKLELFKLAFMQKRKQHRKEKMKEYNKEYYKRMTK